MTSNWTLSTLLFIFLLHTVVAESDGTGVDDDGVTGAVVGGDDRTNNGDDDEEGRSVDGEGRSVHGEGRSVDGEGRNIDGYERNIDGYESGSKEFEEKIIRAWMEYFIDKYNNVARSSTDTTNIQRIAKKKGHTSALTTPKPKKGNIAPFPIYPFFFHPYYHPTIYSSYIPLQPYSATSHAIPISHTPYPYEEYLHRFLVPVHTTFPYAYTHVPSVMSSTATHNHLKLKKPIKMHTFVSSTNNDKNQNYVIPDETSQDITKKILNQNLEYDQTSLVENPLNESANENMNSVSGRKLHNNIDIFLNSTTNGFHQTDESHTIKPSLLLTTIVESYTSTPLEKIYFPGTTHDITSTTSSELSSSPEIFNSPYSRRPSSVQKSNLSDKLNATTELIQQSSTTEKSFTSSIAEQPDTISEIEPMTSIDYDTEETSVIQSFNLKTDQNQPNFFLSTQGKNVIKNTWKASINTGENPLEKIETTHNPETLITSYFSSSYPTTTLFSTPLCEKNDCRTSSETPPVIVSNIDTKLQTNSKHDNLIKMRSFESTSEFAKVDDKYKIQIDIVSSSTHPLLTSTTIPEMTTLSSKPSPSSDIVTQSLLSSPELFDTTKPLYLNITPNISNSVPSSSLDYSLSPSTPVLNKHNTTLMSSETITTEKPQSITVNNNDYTTYVKQDKNISKYNDKTTTSPPVTTSVPSRTIILHEPLKKTTKNNYPSRIKTYPSQIRTTTEKTNPYNNDKLDHYDIIRATTKTMKKSLIKPKVTFTNALVKNHNKDSSKLLTVTDDSNYRTSTDDRDRFMTDTSKTPHNLNDTETWYNNMFTQHPYKKELSEKQIDFLLKKLISLLKPEIEKQTITKESIDRLISPKLGDRDKLIYIILPLVRDVANNTDSEKPTESNTDLLKTSDKT